MKGENVTIPDERIQKMQAALQRLNANMATLQNSASDWKPKRANLEQSSRQLFAHWAAQLKSCDFSPIYANMQLVQNKLRAAKDFAARQVTSHPNVRRAERHIASLWLQATLWQILIFAIRAVIILSVLALSAGLLYGLWLAIQFLIAQIPVVLNWIQGILNSIVNQI